MENIAQAYNQWAAVYDSNDNKTRDAEALLLRRLTAGLQPEKVLELGCGTGKNSVYLAALGKSLTAVDFSEAMMQRAQEKCEGLAVEFVVQDLTQPGWAVAANTFDLAVFSLVLEHLPSLFSPFAHVARCLRSGGYLYVGELHPFKQYLGSQARFTNAAGVEEKVTAFTHHFQDYWQAAQAAGLTLVQLAEAFHEADAPGSPPRLIGWLFQKQESPGV